MEESKLALLNVFKKLGYEIKLQEMSMENQNKGDIEESLVATQFRRWATAKSGEKKQMAEKISIRFFDDREVRAIML